MVKPSWVKTWQNDWSIRVNRLSTQLVQDVRFVHLSVVENKFTLVLKPVETVSCLGSVATESAGQRLVVVSWLVVRVASGFMPYNN